MRRRRAINPKLRFDVLKRDGFKCRYCGVGSTQTILEIDHVKPVAKGGTDHIGNLFAACVECNQGKAARQLPDSPDAMWSKAELDKIDGDIGDVVVWFWRDGTSRDRDFTDDEWQALRSLVRRYGATIVEEAISLATNDFVIVGDDGVPTEASIAKAFAAIRMLAAAISRPSILYERHVCPTIERGWRPGDDDGAEAVEVAGEADIEEPELEPEPEPYTGPF